MARRLHRDKSTLSRFERGETVPRDLEFVIGEYAALRPRQPTLPDLQPTTQHNRLRRWVTVWSFARWGALAIAEIVAGRVDQDRLPADDLRVFVALSAIGLYVMLAIRWIPRIRDARTSIIAVALRELLPAGFFAVFVAARFGHPRITVPLALAALTWVELGYIVWICDHYRRA